MTTTIRLLAILLAGAAMPAHAEQSLPDSAATEGTPATEMDEIVVTGMKFDRSLQETPTSVQVFTAEQIERQNLISVYDLIDRTANLSSTFGKSGFNIRGIASTNVSGTGFGDLATVYLDGSPLPREASAGGPLDLWDLEQVEILRGPQSTLQGRNALAGSIILKTADPSFVWKGKARAMFTDANGETRLAAAVGGPIIPDVLAFRVAGELARDEGLIKNTFTNRDYDESESETIRTKLLFTPWGADSLRVIASYLHDRHKGNNGRAYSFVDRPNSWNNRTVEANRETYTKTNTNLFTLDMSLPLNNVFTLSSISTYNRLKSFATYDGEMLPEDQAYGDMSSKQSIFSQEGRLTFDTGALQGIVGAYYSKHKNPEHMAHSTFSLDLEQNLGLSARVADFLVANAGFTPADAAATAQAVRVTYPERIFISSAQHYPFTVKTQALFGDASWQLSPSIKLLAGFRFDQEKQFVRNQNSVTLNTTLPDPADYIANPSFAFILNTVNTLLLSDVTSANSSGPVQSTTYKAFLPKGGVSWEVAPDKTVSAIIQRGYRSGGNGINPGRASAFAYDPEYTWNYELSARTQWLDRRLTLNANAFYIDWSNQQVTVQLSENQYDYETRNAGKSRVWGAEIESSFQATGRVSVYGSVGYANSKFREFTVQNGTVQSLAGNAFANAPEWTAAAGFDWRHPSGFSLNMNANYRGAQFQNVVDQANGRNIPARTLVNAKFGYNNETFGAYLVAKNIFNEEYYDNRYQSGDRVQALLGEPRMIGVTLEGRF